jgi:photosystem II stability/assembly factor-like uncharacterized protein
MFINIQEAAVKKLAVIALILLLVGALSACQAQEPTPTATPIPSATPTAVPSVPTGIPTIAPTPPLNSPNGPPLRTIQMFPEGDGWGLIYNALLLTHDGGQSWFTVPMPEGQVDENTRIYFDDVNTLYLIVPAPDGKTGQLYQTANGGGTWRISAVPFQNGYLTFAGQTGFFLATVQNGPTSMAVGLFTSADDGLTWNLAFPGQNPDPGSSLPDEGFKTGIAFIDPLHGWMGVAGQAQKVVLYQTTNGGQNWLPQEILAPQNIASLKTTTLPPIFFPDDPTQGLLPVDYISLDGSDRNRVFYFTNDAGANWIPGQSVVESDAFTFLDAKTGWTWGKRGIYYTNDGAQSWQLLPVAFGRSEHAISLSFIDRNNGWMLTADASNRARLYNTKDGGNTWTAFNP